jgi:hypothetical protein
MSATSLRHPGIFSARRQFIGGAVAAAVSGAVWRALAAEPSPVFVASDREFAFNTGALRGTLRGGGRSKGLIPVLDATSGEPLARSYGWFSPYRLLDDTRRYGDAAWSWASEARLLPDGAVEVRWTADAVHPFDQTATYRWSARSVLDFSIQVTARRALRRFEVFLASYFEGFPTTVVYAGQPAAFASLPRAAGEWQLFPRDDAAVRVLQDGRWQHPPNPIEWALRPRLAAPLAVRRDAARDRAAVLMTLPEECFAVAAPYDEEVHRSVYFSLFGRDLRAGESVGTRARLWVGPGISDAKALELYAAFRDGAAH